MDRYSTHLALAIFAAAVAHLTGRAAVLEDRAFLSEAREGWCITYMGRRVAELDAEVSAFMSAYREIIVPRIDRGDPQ